MIKMNSKLISCVLFFSLITVSNLCASDKSAFIEAGISTGIPVYGDKEIRALNSKYSDDEADRYNSVCFEIKPCLGDDFPAVLRQMKKNSNRYSGTFSVCIIDEFSASGATYEQVQQMFRASKFSLLKFSDFE